MLMSISAAVALIAIGCGGTETIIVMETVIVEKEVEVEKFVEVEVEKVVVQTVVVEREVQVAGETVVQTVVVEREVVREVEVPIEVVREVQVEVPVEIEKVVEVVREVEVMVVATPTPASSPTPGPTETPTPTPTASPTPEPPSTPAELVERVRDSVVRVEAGTGGFFSFTSSGSGFIFAVEGITAFVATNHHIVDGKSSVEVQIGDSDTYDALVLGWDAERDVAVLSICCSSEFIALTWADASPSEGETVIAIGYPDSDSGNLIATIGELRSPDDLSIEHDFIPHSAPLNPGNSGGPLFSMPGAEVVGINTARGTETLAFYAVPYGAIEEQMEEWRSQLIVEPTTSPTPTTINPANTLFQVKLNGVIYTVHSIIDPAPERSSLSLGERAVAIDVSIEAVEDGTDYDEDDFVLQDSDGYIHDPDWFNRGVEPDLGSGTLAVGQRVRGWVNFNVAEHARLTALLLETGRREPRAAIADLSSEVTETRNVSPTPTPPLTSRREAVLIASHGQVRRAFNDDELHLIANALAIQENEMLNVEPDIELIHELGDGMWSGIYTIGFVPFDASFSGYKPIESKNPIRFFGRVDANGDGIYSEPLQDLTGTFIQVGRLVTAGSAHEPPYLEIIVVVPADSGIKLEAIGYYTSNR